MDAQLWHAHARFTPVAPRAFTESDLRGESAHAVRERKQEGCAWVSHLHLEPDPVTQLATDMTRIVEQNRHTPPGAKTIVGVTAPNTAGKSTLVRRWALAQYRAALTTAQLSSDEMPNWRPTRNIDADLVPVVWMNLQAGAGRKEFNAQLLHFLGHRSEGYLRATNERVAVTIARQGVRLIIVDDVHLLRTQHRDGQTVLDHLKYINTALGEHHATLVLVGANLRGGDIAADPQIAGRMRLLEVPTFPVDTVEDKVAWQRLLKHAEAQLAPYLPRSSAGFLVSLSGLIWRRTQGFLGDLGNLLRQAAYQAISSETWAIDADLLESIPLSERATQAEAARLTRASRNRKAG